MPTIGTPLYSTLPSVACFLAVGFILLTWVGCRAICRDPVVFPDPERFDPQRWLTADGSLRQDVKSYPFGFGRRSVSARGFV